MLTFVSMLLSAGLTCVAAPVDNTDCHDARSIQLPSGRFIGHHNSEASVTTYFSIPYARADRFELATPIDEIQCQNPNTVVNATKHGPACVNFDIPPPYNAGFGALLGDEPLSPQSEDCLTMDVYVPDGDLEGLPVYFYMPGGGFLVGASFTYDMTPIVSHSLAINKPIIAVTINYRLGPLGFLNTAEWYDAGKVNLGMLDQLTALRWVKKYIHRFGGDASKVTLSGQSAGADSAMQHLLWSDPEESLFRAAWVMSVPSTDGPFLEPRPQPKDELVRGYAKACGCKGFGKKTEVAVDCLRETPTEVLVNASIVWQGSGANLGGFIKERAFDAIEKGHYPKVPIVMSVCRDEGTNTAIGFKSDNDSTTSLILYTSIRGRELTDEDATTFLTEMLAAYSNEPALGAPFDGRNTTYGQPSQYKRMSAIASDASYTAPWRWYLETFSQKTDVWGLLFEEPIPGVKPALGVQHGSDMVFYFPEMFGEGADPRENGYAELVDAIHDALVNFVNDGDPNGHGADCGGDGYTWPGYDENSLVTVLNASMPAAAVQPPYRPGFDVIEEFLISEPEET